MEKKTPDVDICGKIFPSSCDNYMALPVVYYFSYKYCKDFEKAIIVDCNAGGDNGGRTCAIAALVAAFIGSLVDEK